MKVQRLSLEIICDTRCEVIVQAWGAVCVGPDCFKMYIVDLKISLVIFLVVLHKEEIYFHLI